MPIKRKRVTIGGVAALVIIAITIAVELARPGTTMCPLRRVLAAVNISLPIPELSPEQKAQAKQDAKAWREIALKRFPNLKTTPHPIADDENGFLQLYLLENITQPSSALTDLQLAIYSSGEDPDQQAVREALAENHEWVTRLESIAALTQQSSSGMPDGYTGFFPSRSIKLAFDTLMLKAQLAADDGDSVEALRCVASAGNLIDHLQQVEDPTLLTEMVCILSHRSLADMIMNRILPRLGPSTPLAAWREQVERLEISPQRLAVAYRGEWNTASEYFGNLSMAMAHQQRMLPDPEATVMAYAQMMSDFIASLSKATIRDLQSPLDGTPNDYELSYEGHSVLMSVAAGRQAWNNGYLRGARIHAAGLAVFDLLALEAAGHTVTAESCATTTRDPLTGEPMDFDPKARTLELPGDYPDYELYEPLKLPW